MIHRMTAIGLACLACFSAPAARADDAPAQAAARPPSRISEQDYLGDVPTVISVSRLSQTLAETPGAVSILDRAFIRMTGARSVVDVLRFVPGFQTTNPVETDAPMATYHGRNDDWANRIQVLVDGRSVYSGLLQGSAGIGWQTLALDDIERIEVLRGSNSATYGARAFLGVVNIISRDVRETIGAAASLTQGENGVDDVGVRGGWELGDAALRLSVDGSSDDGLRGAFGHSHTERANLASHLALAQGAELELRAGAAGAYLGRGDPTDTAGNPARRWFLGSQFVQADWRRPLSDTQDLSLSASHTEYRNIDRAPFLSHTTPPLFAVDYYGTTLDNSGEEWVDALTLQHTVRLDPSLRTVWGAELRHERVRAPSQFDSPGDIPIDYQRLFGSAEWRIHEDLLLNAGALAEHNTISGDSLSPRLMLNWQAAPGHTLRAGASTAFRPPSAYEKYGRVRYYDTNGQNPTNWYVYNDGSLRPERLQSSELGYYFAPAPARFSGDLRLFQEQIRDGITATDLRVFPWIPRTTFNGLDYTISGTELQLQWNPTPATRVLLAQAWTSIAMQSDSGNPATRFRAEHGAPRYAASLALMHSLDSGWHATLMHQVTDDVALMSISDNPWLFSMQRTDLRLAKEWRIGRDRLELALTAQNLGEPTQDGDWKFRFYQRTLVSLRYEH